MYTMTLALAISAFIFSLISLGLGLYAVIEILAQKRSTHAIQYVPADTFKGDIETEQKLVNTKLKSMSKVNDRNDYIPLSDAEDFLDV